MEDLINYLNDKFGNKNKHYAYRETDKYYKVVISSYGTSSAYAFISKVEFRNKVLGNVFTGDILKASSWNTPAKHARGKLDNKTTWDRCFGEYSVVYLR